MIEVQELDPQPVTEILVPPPKPEGWLAFYRWDSGTQWMVVSAPAGATYDRARCPWPLFPTKQEAALAGQAALPTGGTVKIVKVIL
jgi:hypothetical protein